MLKSIINIMAHKYLQRGTKAVPNTAAADLNPNNTNQKVIFKNCAPFKEFRTEINNT